MPRKKNYSAHNPVLKQQCLCFVEVTVTMEMFKPMKIRSVSESKISEMVRLVTPLRNEGLYHTDNTTILYYIQHTNCKIYSKLLLYNTMTIKGLILRMLEVVRCGPFIRHYGISSSFTFKDNYVHTLIVYTFA